MKIVANAVEFEAFGIPIIGNLDNGYVIGLSPEGRAICHQLLLAEASKEDIVAVDERLYQHLERGRFFENTGSTRPARTAYLHVTQRCNLDCVGCYSFDESRNKQPDLTFEEICACLEYLRSSSVCRLIISGGEPFLRDNLSGIVHYAKQVCRFDVVEILTNGTVISNNKLEGMSDHVDRISVSFDGPSSCDPALIRKEQRFEQLVDAISVIKANGIRAHILPTIHSSNVADIDRYKELARNLDATISFSLFSPVGESATIDDAALSDIELAELATRMIGTKDKTTTIMNDTPINANLAVTAGCGAGCGQMSISAAGDVYPCHMLHCDEFNMGSALETKGSGVALDCDRFPITVDSIDECKDCDIRFFCGGGCRARAYRHSKNIQAKDPYCTLMKSFYSQLFDTIKTSQRNKRR